MIDKLRRGTALFLRVLGVSGGGAALSMFAFPDSFTTIPPVVASIAMVGIAIEMAMILGELFPIEPAMNR
jgi:hypothetical protein